MKACLPNFSWWIILDEIDMCNLQILLPTRNLNVKIKRRGSKLIYDGYIYIYMRENFLVQISTNWPLVMIFFCQKHFFNILMTKIFH